MKNVETEKMTFPHNLPCGQQAAKKILKLVNTAYELGGTVYDVAADAGLLSAYHYMEVLFDVEGEEISSKDMTVVTEVYVRYSETAELERIFLYSDNASTDNRLLEEGHTEAGKLIIDYDKLKSLHEKGFKCYYQRADEAGNVFSSRFKDVFGKDQKRISFKLWDSDFNFIGSGFNQALLVQTKFGMMLVMPDIYAVQQCIKVVYAEKLIQERYKPTFSIERTEKDAYVVNELELVRFQLFGRRKLTEYEEFYDSYRMLTQQVAYIKVHYLMVYDIVWDEKFEIEDERTIINWDDYDEVTLGISISEYEGCYAVFRNKEGRAIRVPDFDCPYEMPLQKKYKFKGCGNLRNAGVAGSRLGLIFKDIVSSMQAMFDVGVKKVNITCMSEFPYNTDIIDFMEARKKRLKKNGIPEEEDVSLIAYQEAPYNICTSGGDIIEWAAELAGLKEAKYVGSINATVTAFEEFARKNAPNEKLLEENEIGLIYEMSENQVELHLFIKEENGAFHLIDRRNTYGPVNDDYYDADELEEDEYSPDFDYVLGYALEEFMLSEGLRALGIYGETESDERAFEELRNSAPKVRQQLRRCDSAKVIFNNVYLSMLKEFPIERFERCYKPLLERNKRFLEEFLSNTDYSMDDIKKVYLVGSEWQYPFVRKYIEEIVGEKACYLAPFDCVAARGAAFMD